MLGLPRIKLVYVLRLVRLRPPERAAIALPNRSRSAFSSATMLAIFMTGILASAIRYRIASYDDLQHRLMVKGSSPGSIWKRQRHELALDSIGQHFE